MAELGLALTRGDRRGHVIVTADGQVIAVARAAGVKTKDVRAKLGEAEDLPSVSQAQAELARDVTARFAQAARAVRAELSTERRKLDADRAAQIAAHRAARKTLKSDQDARRAEAYAEIKHSRSGLAGLWDRIARSGSRFMALREAKARLKTQDDAERQELRRAQLEERRALEAKRTDLRREAFGLVDEIRAERNALVAKLTGTEFPSNLSVLTASPAPHDPRQTFVATQASGPVTDAQIRAKPERLLERLSYFDASFSAGDISRALAKIFADPIQLAAAQKAVHQSSDLVSVPGSGLRYTTRGYIEADQRLLSSARDLLATRAKAPSRSDIDHALAKQNRMLLAAHGVTLSGEQRNAIGQMVNSARLSMVVGRAGTGKSTILAAANEAWVKSGISVHGAALSGKAAAGLEDASGIPSRTLASLELSWANGNAPIKPGDVLVIDEAGMIGTRQLDRIAAKIHEIGAKLVLVGDPDQLPPIEAGEPFRGLVDRHGASFLTEIHLQKASWQKEATGDLAQGRITQAVARYDARGCVTTAPSTASAITQLTEQYLTDSATDPQTTRLILAHRRRDVHALNQSVRETLKAATGLPDGILLPTDHGPREMATGDRIVFTANDRETGVKNGMLGTLRSANEGKLAVDLDDGGRITFNPRQFRAFDHGYAVTIHKSQGVTVDQAYVLASRSMEDALSYVALSRHRKGMRLYVSAEDRPKWAQAPLANPSRRPDRSWSLEL